MTLIDEVIGPTPERLAKAGDDIEETSATQSQNWRAIRMLEAHARTPIIAMTANAFAEDKARCLAAGMSDFLAKPFDPSTLYQVLLHGLRQGEEPSA